MNEHRLPIVVDGLRLSGGVVVPDDPKGLVVLFHGIPSVSPPEPGDQGYPGFARWVAEDGWAAAWADFRGVRGSPGYFSIEGWVRDARAAIDAARAEVPGVPVAVLGSSAGGAVAIEAAKRGAPVDALVTFAAPANWVSYAGNAQQAVARIVEQAGMPLSPETIADPQPWADEFGNVVSEDSIGSLKIPVLVVHGTADDVVAVDHADRISARGPKAEVRLFEGAGHQLRKVPEAVEAALEWLEGVLR